MKTAKSEQVNLVQLSLNDRQESVTILTFNVIVCLVEISMFSLHLSHEGQMGCKFFQGQRWYVGKSILVCDWHNTSLRERVEDCWIS